MNIIFLGTRGFPNVQGGVEKHCENLAVRLAAMGCRVTVFTRRPYVDRSLKEYMGVRLVDLPAVRRKNLEALLHTFLGVFKCLKYKPDILHMHGIGPGLLIPLAKLFGISVVLTTHGSNYMHEKWNRAQKVFLRLCEYISIRFADRIIAVSEDISRDIRKRYGREAQYIPNGVQAVECVEPGNTLGKYHLEAGRYILAVGRIVPEKGFHDLVEAFRSVSAEGWKLVIAGGADHTGRYSGELFKRMEQDERIVYTGFLSENPLRELYAGAGLYVLPSSYEGMPISLLEAICSGLYCIVSDIAANRSIGLPEEHYFKAGDCRELAGHINRAIIENKNVRMTRQQINELLEEYDWSRIAERTLKVYCGVLSAVRPGTGMRRMDKAQE